MGEPMDPAMAYYAGVNPVDLVEMENLRRVRAGTDDADAITPALQRMTMEEQFERYDFPPPGAAYLPQRHDSNTWAPDEVPPPAARRRSRDDLTAGERAALGMGYNDANSR